jgi:hypothetical protein
MPNSAPPLNELLAAHLNSLQFRSAAPQSLSAHNQRPGFLALPPACDLAFFCSTASGHITGPFNPHTPAAVSSNWIPSELLAASIPHSYENLSYANLDPRRDFGKNPIR